MTAQVEFARAVEFHRRGQLAEAEQVCRAVLMAEPSHFGALYMLGVVALQRGAFEAAVDQIGRALAVNPKAGSAHRDRGMALVQLGRFAEALENLNQAIAFSPGHPVLYYNRGVIRQQLGEFAGAIADYDSAIALKPDLTEGLNNRGNALKELGRLDEALASYDAAIAIKPDFAECFYNRGALLLDLKRPDAAIASYDRALALMPDHAEARFGRGVCRLAMGRMDEAAWSDYESRWRLKNYSSPESVASAPRWAGEDLAGQSIFVYAEQGLGDTIQFGRFVPDLAARGAAVTFMVPRKLMALFSAMPKPVRLVSEVPPEHFDFQCPVMSLPQRLNVDLDSIPNTVPYLAFDAARAAAWRDRIGLEGFKIGITWYGAPWHGGAAVKGRSIPLDAFAPLSRIDGVRLISLQKGEGVEQLATLPSGMRVESLAEDFDAGPDAFADAAAIMQALDLIVTCDTSMAHVAGGLGRPVWIALKHVPEWRWMLDRSDSPWYPTARLFRQKIRGDWGPAFDEIAAAVRAKLARD